jgi:hypothetical protein
MTDETATEKALQEARVAEREARRTVVRDAQHGSLLDIYNAVDAHVAQRLAASVPPMTMTAERETNIRDADASPTGHRSDIHALLAEVVALRAALSVSRAGDECPFCHHEISEHYDADACLVEGCGCFRYASNHDVKWQGDALVKLRAELAAERDKYTALVEAAREQLLGRAGVDSRRMLSVALRALDPNDPAVVQPAERCPDCGKPLPHAFNFACEGHSRKEGP